MPSVNEARLMAPWWRDYQTATIDGKLTKREVTKYIAPHSDVFDDPNYGKALKELLKYDGPGDVKLTRYAKKELKRLMEPPIWWPTNEQLKRIYGGIAVDALDSGRAVKLAAPPPGIDTAPSWDITPPGLAGTGRMVFLVDGNIILRETVVTFPPQATYYDCGPAPLF